MRRLLSLPPNAVSDYQRLHERNREDWFCTLDPRDKRLGSGSVVDLIKDYTLGYKLPGAGGGGYLYMVAKDPDASVRIRKILNENRPNNKARFVEMQLSYKGFQVSRS